LTSGTSGPAAGRWTTIVVVAAATAVQAVLTWAMMVLPAIAPKLASALGLPPALIGYQVSLLYGGAIVTSLVGGAAVRRWGACRISQASLVFGGVGCALAALPSLPLLALASLLIGMGYGLTNPPASHLLSRVAQGRYRNMIFSIKQTGVPIGGVLAGLTAPPIALAFGWQWAPLAVTAACVLLILALQPARSGWDFDRDPTVKVNANPLVGLRPIWTRPVLRWLSAMAFCYAFLQLCLMTFLVTLLVEELTFSLVAAGFLLSLAQVAGVLGRVLWGWTADRLGDGLKVLIGIGAASLVLAAVTASMTPAWPPLLIQATFAVFGFIAIGWNGVYLAEVARVSPPGQVSAATGGSLSVTYTGVMCGPAAFALAYGLIGSYTATFGLLAGIALAGIVAVTLARLVARTTTV
jgi:predicted MFS family arabinose efflux permease